MSHTPSRGVAPVPPSPPPAALPPAAPTAPGPAALPANLPTQQVNAARYNIDLQIGPNGARLVVMAGGIVIGHSGWSMDLDACWQSIAPILMPSFVRVANAQCAPVDYDA